MKLAPGTVRLLSRLLDGNWVGTSELCEDKDGVTMDVNALVTRGFIATKKRGLRTFAYRITEKGRAALREQGRVEA